MPYTNPGVRPSGAPQEICIQFNFKLLVSLCRDQFDTDDNFLTLADSVSISSFSLTFFPILNLPASPFPFPVYPSPDFPSSFRCLSSLLCFLLPCISEFLNCTHPASPSLLSLLSVLAPLPRICTIFVHSSTL